VGIEDRLPIIESLVAATQEEEQKLAHYLAGLRSKRDEMERDLQLIRDRKRQDKGQVSGAAEGSAPGSNVERRVEKAGGAVARVKASVTGLPTAEDTGDAAARAELEELHRKNRVAERLAALKKES